ERKKEEQRVAEQQKQLRELYRARGLREEDIPASGFRKRLAHIQDQYIVLIGGYPDQETAHKSLPTIRKLGLPSGKDEGREFDRINRLLLTSEDNTPDRINKKLIL